MKYLMTFLTLLSVFSFNTMADPVDCQKYDDSNWLYKKTIETCSFKYMYGNYQMSTYIPLRYKNQQLNRSSACGPTAIASIYKHIYYNKDYYKPKENSFFSQVADKDVEQILIPELYFKMKTRYNYGTMPVMIYTEGLSAKYFDDSFTEFYSFFESGVFNTNTDKYFEWVKRRNPMAVVVGYIKPSCVYVLGFTKCSLMVPETLHYEAIAGATQTKRIKLATHYINLWDGNNTWQPETTDLVQVNDSCKRFRNYSVCTDVGFSFSFKSGPSLCQKWESKVTCELSYIFPIGMSKGMRFTSDDTNLQNTKAQWTFMLGYFGLNKK